MALCPYCEKEVSYRISDENIVQARDFPLLELSCDHCRKVISVIHDPEHVAEDFAKVFKKLGLCQK